MQTAEVQKFRLPEGKTCGDCKHFSICHFAVQKHPRDVWCHWVPPRWQEKRLTARDFVTVDDLPY